MNGWIMMINECVWYELMREINWNFSINWFVSFVFTHSLLMSVWTKKRIDKYNFCKLKQIIE